jgi:hypothetical protein
MNSSPKQSSPFPGTLIVPAAHAMQNAATNPDPVPPTNSDSKSRPDCRPHESACRNPAIPERIVPGW